MAGYEERIDLDELLNTMKRCTSRRNSVDIKAYLEAYRLVYRFVYQIDPTGKAAEEILSKLAALERRQMSDRNNIYKTVDSLVTYEKKNNLLRGGSSGARLLLLLHRAILFILELLKGFNTLKDSDTIYDVAQEAFDRTLAPFYACSSTAVRIALVVKKIIDYWGGALTMEFLVTKTCVQSPNEFRKKIPEILKLGQQIYDLTQEVYRVNRCLDLK